MKKMLSASIMCADFGHLQQELQELEQAGIDYIHCDIMDGMFVPNITLGFDLINNLKKATSLPLDVHMMVQQPERFFDNLQLGAEDVLTIHAEATQHLERALTMIRSRGIRAGIALNPQTSIQSILDVACLADLVTVMTVSPGFAGQKLFVGSEKKVRNTRQILEENGLGHIAIQVDGNINLPNARKLSACGADVFVLGSSGLFLPDTSLKEAAAAMQQAIYLEEGEV